MGLPRRVPPFVWGALAVCVARGLVAASRLDEFRGEELYIGTLARAWLAGVPVDPTRLPVIVHLRGSVVFAVLAVPLVAVLGATAAALKTLAVLWSAATGGLLATALRRRAGTTAAAVGVGLYALAPPSFQMVDVLALGSHGDVVLPIAAALVVLLGRDGPLGAGRAAALGALLGLGLFFSLQFAVALPALLAAWLAHDPRFPLRRASLAAALGAAPLLALVPLASTSSTLVNKPMSGHLLPEGVGGGLAKLGAALAGDVRRSWLFEDAGGAWAGWLFLASALAGLALLAPRLARREPLAVFCLLHPVLVVGAYAFSDFELNLVVRLPGMGSRYLMPMLPFVGCWVALGAAWLVARGRRGAAVALAAPAAVAGAAGLAALLELGTPGRLPPVRGTNAAFFGAHVDRGAGDGLAERLAWARRLEPDWDAYRPLTHGYLVPARALPPPGAPPRPGDLARLAALPAELRPALLAALGARLGATTDRAQVTAALERLADRLPDPAERAWLLRGLGRGTMELGIAEVVGTQGGRATVFRVLDRLPEPARAEAALGAGLQLGLVYTPYHDLYRALVARAGDELAADQREPFHRGLGLGWRLRFVERSYRPPAPLAADVERLVAAEDRPALRAGLEAPHGAW